MYTKILVAKYNSIKDCFIHVPSNFLKSGSCVELTFGNNNVAYFSVSAPTPTVKFANESVGINSVYAKILGIVENELVTVSEILQLPTISRITIAPVNANEYEILELLSENVQSTLLDQIRVINTGQKFVIWVARNISIVVYVENVEPKAPGIIDFLTEVVIKPKCDFVENTNLSTISQAEKTTNQMFNIDKLKAVMFCSEDKINMNLEKFLNTKMNLICRLVPINQLPLSEEIATDRNEFDVFISKHYIPKSWFDDKSLLICSVKLLSTELISEKVIYVKLCILEDLFDKSNSGDNLFVSSAVLEYFDCQIGSRVILKYVEEKPVVNEIQIYTKKNYLIDVEHKFKLYLAKHCDNVMVLNPDILLNIGDNIKSSLKFSPAEAKFCIVDNDFVRNCKYCVNEEIVTISNGKVRTSQIPDNLLENMPNYTNIVNSIISQYSENIWENVLVTGRPGTGKSTLLKIVAKRLNSYPNFIYTKIIYCKAIKGKTVDSLLKLLSSAFSELVLYQPSVLLLDDLHLLCGNIEGDEITPNAIYSNRVSEMLYAFLNLISQFNDVGICVTAESVSKLNKNIYSSRGTHLFKNLYSITELTKAGRIQLLKHFFAQYDVKDVNFDDASVKAEGFVVQDIVDFCNKAVFEAYKDGSDSMNITLTNDHLEKALKNTCVLSLQNIQLHSAGSRDFLDIGGLHDVKKILVENLMWPAQYPNIFLNAPLRLQSGLLLYGPPGTGKTLLAGAAAKHCALRLISIKGPELLSKYIGASEQAVRDIFQKAQNARSCILFFDEFDSLAPRRGHDNTGVTDRVVNQLLTQLDGVESLSGVCVLAATSRPDLLDPALLRPGRLDRQILCSLPSMDDRLEILTILSKNLKLADDVNLNVIATATEGYSGADLQSILYTAQLSTIDHLLDDFKGTITVTQITQQHLKDALSKTRPSLAEPEKLKYEKIYAKFQGENTIDDFMAGSKATLA